ncbi:MAG TPA: hypothetical protein ENI23_00545 [bacterium]|nr:hypothetical protein [bacterium]
MIAKEQLRALIAIFSELAELDITCDNIYSRRITGQSNHSTISIDFYKHPYKSSKEVLASIKIYYTGESELIRNAPGIPLDLKGGLIYIKNYRGKKGNR